MAITKERLETRRAQMIEELQKAQKEVTAWTRLVAQLEGAVGNLNQLLAEVEAPGQAPDPDPTPETP